MVLAVASVHGILIYGLNMLSMSLLVVLIISQLLSVRLLVRETILSNSLLLKGYHTVNSSTHKSSVSFTDKITDFINGIVFYFI